MSGIMELVSHKLFDTESIKPYERVHLFLTPVGFRKDTTRTNMLNSGTLPPGNLFSVRSLTVAFFRDNKPVSLRDPLWNQVEIAFYINRKLYVQDTAWRLIDPVSVLAWPENWLTGRFWKGAHIANLKREPMAIERQEFFKLEATARDVQEADIQVALHGDLFRPVQ